jgi:hypothetical protein
MPQIIRLTHAIERGNKRGVAFNREAKCVDDAKRLGIARQRSRGGDAPARLETYKPQTRLLRRIASRNAGEFVRGQRRDWRNALRRRVAPARLPSEDVAYIR